MTSLVTCASARGMMRANKLVRSLCSTAPPRRNAFKQALKQAAVAQSQGMQLRSGCMLG